MAEPTLYELVGEFIRTRPWPKTFYWELYESHETLTFLMFQDNINSLTGEEKEIVGVNLLQLADLNNRGIPIKPALRPSRNNNG